MGKYFGTDGIRGRFGDIPMTEAFAYRLSLALAKFLQANSDQSREQLAPIIIGRDTRASGTVLERAMQKGFEASGLSVIFLGVVPTPAVALGVLKYQACLGIALTASHNPASDNGIKLFNHKGEKFSLSVEESIEDLVDSIEADYQAEELPEPQHIDHGYYSEAFTGLLKESALSGMKIVLDCANGATFKTSPEILKAYGADLVLLGVDPNGSNINEGVGSECPSSLSEAVLQAGADLGLAHDGDGDRLVVCDEKGAIVLGDVLLGIYALDALKYSALGSDTLVVTVQSNLGLDFAVKEAGGQVERVDVGDRNVAEKMRAIGSNLGGESSGHILFSDVCPTGDGLLAALQLLRIVQSANKPLSELSRGIDLFPQETKNLKVVEKIPLEQLPGLQSALIEAEALLSGEGRILLRYSGTEPKLRILVEAKTSEMAKKVMQIVVTEACNGLRVL